ncbi:MAG: ABC transporter ATP-binding protein [Albidovulum sp.]|nr:ABC transporter ATP-binding protein [Albidovulum sp.]
MLEVKGLNKSFGGLHAIRDVDFSLPEGEIRGLIGPNGSGKSTFFNLLSGVYPVDSGTVEVNGKDLTNAEPHEVAGAGIARTFQLLRMFTEMTVLENVMIGYHNHVQYGPLAGVFGFGRVGREEKIIRREMMEVLAFIGLEDFADIPASELSIGQRRLLALGRAMAMKPRLLLLDEPAAGLSPVNVDHIMAIIVRMKEKFGLTVVIVEHILKVVMETCDRVSVLDHGVKIAEGLPQEVRDDEAVVEAYLGREMDDEEVKRAIHA